MSTKIRSHLHPASPYARFNLRRNPFGELTREERAELAVVDVQEWHAWLQGRNKAVQFLGAKGTGKSTHLLAVECSLTNAKYVYLPEDEPLPIIPTRRPLLIDEAQRLPPRRRSAVFAIGGPLVLATHDDLSAELREAGFDVVSVDVFANHSPERLAKILNTRIDASRIDLSPVPQIDIPYARRLIQVSRASIRDIEKTLYDEFQTAAQTGLPWPPAH